MEVPFAHPRTYTPPGPDFTYTKFSAGRGLDFIYTFFSCGRGLNFIYIDFAGGQGLEIGFYLHKLVKEMLGTIRLEMTIFTE